MIEERKKERKRQRGVVREREGNKGRGIEEWRGKREGRLERGREEK